MNSALIWQYKKTFQRVQSITFTENYLHLKMFCRMSVKRATYYIRDHYSDNKLLLFTVKDEVGVRVKKHVIVFF